jgi:hypothetical protein
MQVSLLCKYLIKSKDNDTDFNSYSHVRKQNPPFVYVSIVFVRWSCVKGRIHNIKMTITITTCSAMFISLGSVPLPVIWPMQFGLRKSHNISKCKWIWWGKVLQIIIFLWAPYYAAGVHTNKFIVMLTREKKKTLSLYRLWWFTPQLYLYQNPFTGLIVSSGGQARQL